MTALRDFLSSVVAATSRGAAESIGSHDSGNAPVMMMLGAFKFSLNTAAMQDVDRSTGYRWPAQERIGKLDALQFTGPGADTITLPGVVYPDFRGGAGQIEQLRGLARKGAPLRLIAGTGAVLGMWVIENVRERQSAFKPDASFRRQEFEVSLRKFSDAL